MDVSDLINHYVTLLKEEGWIQSKSVEAAFRPSSTSSVHQGIL